MSRTSNSLAYEFRSAAAVGSVVATVRTSRAAAASVAIRVLATVADAASDVDHPVRPRTRVKERPLALADLERTAVQRGYSERRRPGRLILRDAGLGREHARAEQASPLVDPRPAVDEAEPVRRTVERFDLCRAVVLAQLHLGPPFWSRPDPADIAVLPGRNLARRRSQHVAGAALGRDQPGAAYQRVAGQR